MRRLVVLGAFLLTGMGALAVPSPAAAVLRYVANNGVDSATCGTLAAPCRSITKAIARAVKGDHIVVGPGRYGDVDGDGQFTTPGDEVASAGCDCMLAITKAVTVEATMGAGATVIMHGASTGVAVRVTTVGAVLGTLNKGFTIRSNANGVGVDASNVTVQDNRIFASGTGVAVGFAASGAELVGNIISGTNIAVYLGEGVASLTDNVIEGNGVGIDVARGPGAVISGNHVVNSTVLGIRVQADGTTIRSNVVNGNGAVGVLVASGVGTVVTSNNFINNGGDSGHSNCGLWNQSAAPVNAERNFWGGAQGPGTDPADNVCVTGGAVDSVPFLTKAVVITTQTGR